MKTVLLAALTTVTALVLFLPAPGAAQEPDNPYDWFTAEHADARLLILGTFHFKDAGLDGYKPEVDVDITSERRQAELAALMDKLAAYRPTKVLVEWKVDRQEVTDERYRAYRAGELELGPNEVYQIGFRLAKRMGLAKLHNVDVWGRNYESLPEDLEAYARERGQQALMESPWDERFTAIYRADDYAKTGRTITEHLLHLNDPERLRIGHGHYVLRQLALGDEDEYPAADSLTGWWYNRNIRIFANVIRATEPGDRLLLLIGSGHVPILRHLAEASPEYELLEVAEVLGGGRGSAEPGRAQ